MDSLAAPAQRFDFSTKNECPLRSDLLSNFWDVDFNIPPEAWGIYTGSYMHCGQYSVPPWQSGVESLMRQFWLV
jgi:hypothetical protein